MKKKINLPNKITIFRMLVVVVILIMSALPAGTQFGFGAFKHDYKSLSILILFILGSFSDFLDGHIARKNNIVTTFGKFMDPIADKLLVNTLFIILSCTGQIDHWIIPVIMISRDIVVDAIRMIVVEQGTVIAASKLGKLKTVTQMLALILILAFPGVHFMVYFAYLAAVASVVSGVDYFVKNKKVLLSDLRS